MKSRPWLSLLALLFLASGTLAEERGPVVIVPLQSEVSGAQFFFLRRALKQAEREGASAFVIEMKTPGGSLQAAFDNMEALLRTKVPTFTYIDDQALSAGALIAIATQRIYMSPTAVIGAAAPVLSTGDDIPKTMTDKTLSVMSAKARAASQQNGHNPDIAEAFIIKEKELKVGEVVLDKSDSLLTLSTQEATRLFDGKPLLAAGVAASLEEMLEKAGLKGAVVKRIAPTGFERTAQWLTALAPLLLLGGIIGAYIEFKIPGFGIFGITSIICFTLFFTGHWIAGLAGWEAPVLFTLGLALVLAELLVLPGTVLPGIAGIVLILGAIIYAMVDRWPSQPVWPTQEMLMLPLLNVSVAIGAAILTGYLLAKYLPRTSLYQHIVLGAEVPAGPALEPTAATLAVGAGATGLARTTLRPSGKAEFGEHFVDVVTQGNYIEAGERVKVVAIEGARVVVETA